MFAIGLFIIHSTHYLFWLAESASWFSKSAPGTSSSCRLYNNHVKDTQGHGYDHVMYDRGAWFLRVIMSSSRALCCLPSVKKQKHDFQVCFVDWARHREIVEDKDSQNTKRSTKVAIREREISKNLRKKKSWHKIWKHFMSKRGIKNSFNV